MDHPYISETGGDRVLIEELIRLGRPMIEGGLPPGEVIRQVTDILSDNDQNFLSRVYVVEISGDPGSGGGDTLPSAGFRVAALPAQQFGDYQDIGGKSKRKVFVPDLDRASGVPFILAKGGNRRASQGRYPVAVYPIYYADLSIFSNDVTRIEFFLRGRLSRTIALDLPKQMVHVIAEETQKAIRLAPPDEREKSGGLLVLAIISAEGPYGLSDQVVRGNSRFAHIGISILNPGKQIVARLDKILNLIWEAKMEEGGIGGERLDEDARCFFCDNHGHVVSAYNKAWPWFLPTWSCPQPVTWRDEDMVNGIALCPECYGALSYGANIFMKLSSPIETWLTKELFSPVSSPQGKEYARAGRADAIYGCAYALPLLDSVIFDDEARREFVDGINWMLSPSRRSDKLDTHLKEVMGFERILPEELGRDDYRLAVIYYSGNPNKGDIHIRATIEDVVPSTVTRLIKLSRSLGKYALDVSKWIYTDISEGQEAGIKRRFTSIPYLLATAFGAAYLWNTLSDLMHRRPISSERFIASSALRMAEIAHRLPDGDSHWDMCSEVTFYLTFKEFLRLYYEDIIDEVGESGGGVKVRDWKELEEMLVKQPPAEMVFQDVEELGFAFGHLIRLFSRQYWQATKSGERGKDFLKQRVMTFGTSLTPDVLWKRGLAMLEEYARRIDIHMTDDFRQRVGIVLAQYSRWREDARKQKDAFMAAFWSGYALARSDRVPSTEMAQE